MAEMAALWARRNKWEADSVGDACGYSPVTAEG